jgi:hypothetical protein
MNVSSADKHLLQNVVVEQALNNVGIPANLQAGAEAYEI